MDNYLVEPYSQANVLPVVKAKGVLIKRKCKFIIPLISLSDVWRNTNMLPYIFTKASLFVVCAVIILQMNAYGSTPATRERLCRFQPSERLCADIIPVTAIERCQSCQWFNVTTLGRCISRGGVCQLSDTRRGPICECVVNQRYCSCPYLGKL
jgi:hypothetical protein